MKRQIAVDSYEDIELGLLFRGLGVRRLSTKYALLQVLLKQRQPGGTATCFISLGYPRALSDQGYCAYDSTWKSRRLSGVLDNLEINRTKAMIAHDPVSIIDLVLTEQLKGCLQVLPQQVDLGWCEHPRFCRGNELPTG